MPESMAAISMAWTLGMETFVVAHELAHIYANHLDQANAKMLSIRPGGTVSAEFYQLSQQREFEADLLAWQWYQEVWRSIPGVRELNELPGRIAPLSFFTMLDLVEKNVRVPDAYSTHPPALARLINLTASFAKSADKEAVEAAVEELGIARASVKNSHREGFFSNQASAK
jgi:hypothetical protein